jgi:hypothetical protein
MEGARIRPGSCQGTRACPETRGKRKERLLGLNRLLSEVEITSDGGANLEIALIVSNQ